MDTSKHQTDADIVKHIIAGQTSQYRHLIEKYEAKLLRYVIYLIKDPDLSADVVQDTFIKAYRNLRGYNPKYPFNSWIFRIAHNEAMNAVKKNRHIVAESDLPSGFKPFTAPSGIEQAIDRNILKADVQRCLLQLKTQWREILSLYYFEQLSYEEISRILRMPTSTVGVRLKRARQGLRDVCEQNGVKYE